MASQLDGILKAWSRETPWFKEERLHLDRREESLLVQGRALGFPPVRTAGGVFRRGIRRVLIASPSSPSSPFCLVAPPQDSLHSPLLLCSPLRLF